MALGLGNHAYEGGVNVIRNPPHICGGGMGLASQLFFTVMYRMMILMVMQVIPKNKRENIIQTTKINKINKYMNKTNFIAHQREHDPLMQLMFINWVMAGGPASTDT